MRCALVLLLALPALAGCASLDRDVHDEQAEAQAEARAEAEAECHEILHLEARQACLEEVAEAQRRRD